MQRELWDQVDGDLYAILDVQPTATADEIVLAWRSTAKRSHPDLGGSAEEFQQAEIAYEVLSNPLERRRYDRFLMSSHSPRASSSGATFRPPTSWQPTSPSQSPNGYPANGYPFSEASWNEETYRNPPRTTRRWNPWIILISVVLLVAAVVAAFLLAVVTPLLLIGLLIWIVGRSLNPRGPGGAR